MAGNEQSTGRTESGRPVRGVLLDLDGVLYVGEEPLAGAVDAVRGLRDLGVALRFVTNSTTKPASSIASKLERLGIRVETGEILSAVRAAALTLLRLGSNAPYLVVDERVRDEFSGLPGAGAFPDPPHGRPDFVVVGDIGNRWDYDLMNTIFRLVADGARLLAVHKGRAWQTASGLTLDIGAFVAGIEYAAGVEAIVTGKPSAGFYRAALSDMGRAANDAIMVGDDIDSDVGGAQALGIRGVLVRTGKYRREYAARSTVKPWRTLDSVAGLPSLPELTG